MANFTAQQSPKIDKYTCGENESPRNMTQECEQASSCEASQV